MEINFNKKLSDIPIQEFNSAPTSNSSQFQAGSSSSTSSELSGASTSSVQTNARPGSMVRVPELSTGAETKTTNSTTTAIPSTSTSTNLPRHGHSRNSSWDLRVTYNGNGVSSRIVPDTARAAWAPGHSRTTSLDLRHSRNSSADLNKFIRNDVGLVFSPHQSFGWSDPLRVINIKAHHNCICVVSFFSLDVLISVYLNN